MSSCEIECAHVNIKLCLFLFKFIFIKNPVDIFFSNSILKIEPDIFSDIISGTKLEFVFLTMHWVLSLLSIVSADLETKQPINF